MDGALISLLLWLVKPKQIWDWFNRVIRRKHRVEQLPTFALSSSIDHETFNRKHNLHVDIYIP